MTAKVFTIQVQEEDNDLVIEFPEEIMETTGWKKGDNLEWIIHDTYVILRKKPNENSSTE